MSMRHLIKKKDFLKRIKEKYCETKQTLTCYLSLSLLIILNSMILL